MIEKVAVIMAHPDDADISSGGTLIKHRNHGDDILICYLYCSSKKRKKDAEAAADTLNARIKFFQGCGDTKALIQELGKFGPTIIITHWEGDTHHEHIKAYNCIYQITPKLAINHGLQFNLFSCDCYNSLGRNPMMYFAPTDYIDISQVWQEKMALIAAHVSQPTEYLQKMVECQNKIHGNRIGVDVAEGFIQIPVLGVMRRSNHLLKGG